MRRPVLYVLAGVNGAGKSSVGGRVLHDAGLTWFNPDTFARELMSLTACDQQTANARAWEEGVRRLDEAIAERRHFACETTLGGNTIAAKIGAAAGTHDVLMWFCGLDSPERHIARVRTGVAAGGHHIADAHVRRRYPRALSNLIALMPRLAHLQVYDNSAEAAPGTAVPDPLLVLEMHAGRVLRPKARDGRMLGLTPEWAKPVVAAALEHAGF